MSTGMDPDQEYTALANAIFYLEKNKGLAKSLRELMGVDDIVQDYKARLGELEKHFTCPHGRRMSSHPDYDASEDHCNECDWLEWGDIQYDESRLK